MHLILKKRIEPYDLLETLKKHYSMTDLTFDGYTKPEKKKEFMKFLQSPDYLGLYMKNVNKFYLFKKDENSNIFAILGLTDNDYERSSDFDEPLNTVDMGKAEAGIFNF